MNKILKSIVKSTKKGSEIRKELTFAHIIIVLLSLVAIVLLSLGATMTEQFDANLSMTACVLLVILGVISSIMAYLYSRGK